MCRQQRQRPNYADECRLLEYKDESLQVCLHVTLGGCVQAYPTCRFAALFAASSPIVLKHRSTAKSHISLAAVAELVFDKTFNKGLALLSVRMSVSKAILPRVQIHRCPRLHAAGLTRMLWLRSSSHFSPRSPFVMPATQSSVRILIEANLLFWAPLRILAIAQMIDGNGTRNRSPTADLLHGYIQ